MANRPENVARIRAGMLRVLDVVTFLAILVTGALLLDAVMLLMWR